MLDNSLKFFWDDICQIQNMVQEGFPDCHNLLGDFKVPAFPSLQAVIRPALTFLSSELFGGSKYKSYHLASIFQLTHIAWLVHKRVQEDVDIDGNETRRRQYPVLVGDYIYSLCYAKLCSVGLSNFLLPLADIICSVNEGGLLSIQNPRAKEMNSGVYSKVVYKEIAVPFSGACRLGASLGTSSKEKQELLGEFGKAMGMFYGLAQISKDEAGGYSEQALFILSSLEEHPARSALEGLVSKVSALGDKSKEMVV